MFGERTRKVPGSARHQCGGGPVPSTGRVKPGQPARLRTTADKDIQGSKESIFKIAFLNTLQKW